VGTPRATAILIAGLILTALGVVGWTVTTTVADASRLDAAGPELYDTDFVRTAIGADLRAAISRAAPGAATSAALLDQTVATALADPDLETQFAVAWRSWVSARAEGTAPITLDPAIVGTIAQRALTTVQPSSAVGPFEARVVIAPEVQPDPYVVARVVRVPAVLTLAIGMVLVVVGFAMSPSHSAAGARVARWMIGLALVLLFIALALPFALTWAGGGIEVVGALLAGTMDAAVNPALIVLGAGLLVFLVSHVRQRQEEARVVAPTTPMGRPNAATRA